MPYSVVINGRLRFTTDPLHVQAAGYASLSSVIGLPPMSNGSKRSQISPDGWFPEAEGTRRRLLGQLNVYYSPRRLCNKPDSGILDPSPFSRTLD